MTRGLFITFEGGEGAGKTTQIKRLAAALGEKTITTREPGGTPESESLRNLFVAHHGQNWPLEAQLLLMFTARSLHTQKLILPALEKGSTVLCDRYTDSSRVYQGYAGGLALDRIESIKQAAIGEFEPDLTFILDLDPRVGLSRAGARYTADDTFETKDLSFHEKLRAGFLDIAAKNPNRCIVINAAQDEDSVAAEILQKVKSHV